MPADVVVRATPSLCLAQIRNHRTGQLIIPRMDEKKKPIVIITIGMAGAGKSTFVQRINSHLHSQNSLSPPYILNLDPAVTHVPFEPNIDIRDTVDYHEVMKQCVTFILPGRVTSFHCHFLDIISDQMAEF